MQRLRRLPTPPGAAGALVLSVALGVLAPAPSVAQEAAEKKPLALEDYARWSTVEDVTLSPDGRWITFAYDPNEGDATFHLERLDGGPSFSLANGADPAFSPDSRWLGLLKSPGEEEVERLREEREPVSDTLVLLELAAVPGSDGPEEGDWRTEIGGVSSFAFSDDGRFLAVKKDRTDRDAEHEGADLLLRRLDTGATTNVGNVTEYAFSPGGLRLGYLVDAAGRDGNGVYVLELETGRTDALDTDSLLFSGLAWSEDGSGLAALRGAVPDGMEERANDLLTFTGFAGSAEATQGDGGVRASPAAPRRVVYEPEEDPDFPGGHVLSEHRNPEWSEDGRRVLVGIKEQREKLEEDELLKAEVEVWHWKDEEIQSRQQVQAEQDRRRTFASVYNLDAGELVRLADDQMRELEVTDHPRFALGESDAAYRQDRGRPDNRSDHFRVDLDTGERTPIAGGVAWEMGTSPDGRWFVYLQDETVLAREVATDRVVDLSARAGVDFVDREFDRPVEKPTHGLAGWARDGSAVLLNTKYDVWMVPLEEGLAVNLTHGMGEEEEIRFRVVDLERLDGDDEEPEGLNLSRPLLLSAYGERTKKSGFFRTREAAAPEPLLWEDEMIAEPGFRGVELVKAAEADRVAFTRQTFERFPDWWVSGTDFGEPRRVTDANPQQDEYRWGSRVLVDYTDARGNELQATLALPAGYEEGRRYPMLVYFYEQLSQRHHQYSMPTYDDRPHMSTYASNGYLVLMPDIVYETGKPGTSALDDVTSAVDRVIELGYADPDRIGLQGHSWGGYESSFILTQTDRFAAVVTGAPLTNLVSMYALNYKRTGGANQPLIEWSQGRMGVTPWEDMALYHEQSPFHHTPAISTPFLILHGTADGAVDWNQGLEFYNAARRLGKEVILLSYPDEPHHLQEEENQKDFQIRMMEFFDHHLKGEPAPVWMTGGVPWLDRKRVGPDARER